MTDGMTDGWDCPRCGIYRERDLYTRSVNVTWRKPTKANRRLTLCYYCRSSDVFRDEYGKQWDWAAALNKSTAMSVSINKPWDGVWGNVTPHLIRVIDVMQNGQCALTGIKMLKPDASAFPNPRVTLSGWVESLAVRDRDRVPTLVRVSAELPWESGNVMLIIKVAEPLYRYCGGLVTYKHTIRAALDHTVTIPAKDIVDQTADEVFRGQFEAWRKLNNERISEESET